MIKKLIILTLFLVFLSGCVNTNINSRYPTNITYNDDYITWDNIEDATSYILRINDEVYEVTLNAFDASILKNGNYTVQIKSVYETTESYYSPSYAFTVQRTYPIVESLSINDFRLQWSAVDGALSYTISTGERNISSGINQILLSALNLSLNRLYYIYIVAEFPNKDQSAASPTLLHHTYIKQQLTLEKTYEIGSTDFIDIAIPYGETIAHILYNQSVYDPNQYIINNQTLRFSAQTLENLGFGTHLFELLTENGAYDLIIEVTLGEVPQLTSSAKVTYSEHEDLIFTFNLYDGRFDSLNGHSILPSDYLMEGQTLTLKSDFIQRIISENPEQHTLILIYILSLEDNIYSGSIEIDIPTT